MVHEMIIRVVRIFFYVPNGIFTDIMYRQVPPIVYYSLRKFVFEFLMKGTFMIHLDYLIKNPGSL